MIKESVFSAVRSNVINKANLNYIFSYGSDETEHMFLLRHEWFLVSLEIIILSDKQNTNTEACRILKLRILAIKNN